MKGGMDLQPGQHNTSPKGGRGLGEEHGSPGGGLTPVDVGFGWGSRFLARSLSRGFLFSFYKSHRVRVRVRATARE